MRELEEALAEKDRRLAETITEAAARARGEHEVRPRAACLPQRLLSPWPYTQIVASRVTPPQSQFAPATKRAAWDIRIWYSRELLFFLLEGGGKGEESEKHKAPSALSPLPCRFDAGIPAFHGASLPLPPCRPSSAASVKQRPSSPRPRSAWPS